MAAFAHEIQAYKYYVDDSDGGNREIMDQKVYEEKKKAPARYLRRRRYPPFDYLIHTYLLPRLHYSL
jgi:hypothetical protein